MFKCLASPPGMISSAVFVKTSPGTGHTGVVMAYMRDSNVSLRIEQVPAFPYFADVFFSPWTADGIHT
jgi:hypothetical protein